jgi:NAD(P)H-quinone oxidoreductase subunit 5
LALLHVIGHGATRTLQFLRAPSMLHDFHQVHAAAGGHLETGGAWESLAPKWLHTWLYRLALDRGHQDTLLDKIFVEPVLGLARLLRRTDPEGQDA